MYGIRSFLVLSLLVPFAGRAGAQDTVHRVQAVLTGLGSAHHARQADLILRDEPGVIMSRTDLRTSNLYLHVDEASPIDHERIGLLLAPIGLAVRCYQRSADLSAPFRHLDPASCDDHGLKK